MAANKPKQTLADGFKDAMGRQYSTICGFTEKQPLPVGTRIRIHPTASSSSFRSKYDAGVEAVVIGDTEKGNWGMLDPRLPIRYVEPQYQWEVRQNYTRVALCDAEVLVVGDGSLIPGISYRLTEEEVWDARFAAFDFKFQEYTNYPTFLAALYLRQDFKHAESVRGMLRKNGTVNPVRLATYFQKAPDLNLSESDMYQGDFPARTQYRQEVNWVEVAAEFNEMFREEASFA